MLIPKEALEVHKIASRDETRPQLHCVQAQRDDTTPRLTATDGHRLITVTWQEPEVEQRPTDFGDLTVVPGFTANVQQETCIEAGRAVPAVPTGVPAVYGHAWLEEINGDGLVCMGAGDKSLGQAVRCETQAQEVDFPNWRPVIDGVKGSVRVGVNAKLLAELLKVACTISGERGVVLHVPADPQSAIGIHADSADGRIHVDAVLMPMTLDLTGRPDWEDVPLIPGTPPPVPKPEKEGRGEDADEAAGDGAKGQPDLVINTDAKCTQCGQRGTVPSGLCLSCTLKRMKSPKFKAQLRKAMGPATSSSLGDG